METSLDVILDRVASVCAGAPFAFTAASTPFNFDLQPHGTIDGAFRVTADKGSILGGTSYSEIPTDPVVIWLARKTTADPKTVYRQFITDARSLRSALIHDGVTGGGDYDVTDGGVGATIQQDPGKEYAVLRLTIPINYEQSV